MKDDLEHSDDLSTATLSADRMNGGRPAYTRLLPKNIFRGNLDPRKWSLRKRFLITVALFLIAGILSMHLFVSHMMETNTAEAIHDRLRLFDQWLRDEMNTEKDTLTATVALVSTLPDVTQAMATQDRDRLKHFILPFVERIRSTTGNASIYLHFHTPAAVSFLRTWNVNLWGDDLSKHRHMVVKANQELTSLYGFELGQGGPVIRAISPMFSDGTHVGSIEAAMNIVDVLQDLNFPQDYGVTVILDKEAKEPWADAATEPLLDNWLLVKSLGNSDTPLCLKVLASRTSSGRAGSTFFRLSPLEDIKGRRIGSLVLSYDGAAQTNANQSKLARFVWLYVVGASSMWLVLFVMISNVKRFLDKLKKIIIASQRNEFADRFESDHIYCLDVLNCKNSRCPVYDNPSLVCYLETGSEAISPTWRNTCIFLEKYITCHACPVYNLRQEDEINDMRNVTNTMMRSWRVFLGRVGNLLSEVLRSHNQAESFPSLDQISEFLEQMAKLTAFTHDLQGVYSIEEVYTQLDHVFERHFELEQYGLLEVSARENQMKIALQRNSFGLLFCQDVLLNSDLCRAKRAAEEISSHQNHVLCPYFNIDTNQHVRCCLPMVMGGRVGAVFSFIVPKNEWEGKRKQLIMLRKYLDETAPIMSSMQLLQASKEQSLRDPLTHCHNRRFLDEYIAHSEPLIQRTGRSASFVMADLDFFKQVNDQYGHLAGDMVLQQVVQFIRDQIRSSDLLIRYGGEEFLIVLQETAGEFAAEVAEKIRQAVQQHALALPNGVTLCKTISLGVADYPADGDTIYKVIKYADVALYQAKNQGRNRVVRFKTHMWTEGQY